MTSLLIKEINYFTKYFSIIDDTKEFKKTFKLNEKDNTIAINKIDHFLLQNNIDLITNHGWYPIRIIKH